MTAHAKDQVEHQLPVWFTIGFSGHRRLENEQLLREGLRGVFALPELQHHRLACFSSAAAGADTVFAEEAAARNLPRFIILPFDRDTFRKDFDDAQWQRIEPLIDSAIDCEMLPDQIPRTEAFLDAGILTVDRSDLLVVWWNGKEAAGVGGTGDVVAYARLIQKPLIIIDDESGTLTIERLDRLPKDLKGRDEVTAPIESPRQLVVAEFDRQASIAMQHGPKSRNLVLRLILLHLGASAVAIIALQFIDSLEEGWVGYVAASIKLFALSYALFLVRKHHRAHALWIRSRLGTELCRSYLSLWKIRRSETVMLDTEGLGLDSLARSLRILWFFDKAQAAPFDEAREDYQKNRIADQRSYYQSHLDRSDPRSKWGKRFAMAGTIGAISAILITLIIPHHHHDEWLYKIAKSVSLLLPLFSAAVLSYLVALDTNRRAVRYREMVEMLNASDAKLKTLRTWPGFWRLVSETERKLFREVTEWHAVTRFGGDSH